MSSSNYIRWFNELTINDIPLVGGKNASLGERYRQLAGRDLWFPCSAIIVIHIYV